MQLAKLHRVNRGRRHKLFDLALSDGDLSVLARGLNQTAALVCA
jgi:hypothetical protein